MRRSPLIATFLIVAAGAPALAEDDELNKGRVIAVQDRDFRMVHEFTLSTGVLPMDAFYTGYSLGGSYTLHFSDLIAWEAVSFHYSANVGSGLESTLAQRWDVAPTNDPEIQYLLGSNLTLTPLFGKLTFFNRAILHAGTFISVGGGVVRFTDGFRPQVSIGPGVRLFWGNVVSTRLELRNIIAPDFPDGLEYILHVMLSVSFNFGKVRAIESDEDVVRDDVDPFAVLDELYPLSKPKPTEQRREEEP
ncbi:MAG: outer membrane beta-barrel domain-containing protein [Deltaproteobacteria bacterium]